jgi:hypothetical protein
MQLKKPTAWHKPDKKTNHKEIDMEKTLATRYAEAVDQIDAFRQTVAAANQRITELQALADSVPQLNVEIADLKAQAVIDKEASDAVITEKVTRIDELSAEVEGLKGKLAMSPAHIDVGGTSPVDDVPGDKPENKVLTRDDHWQNYAKISEPEEKAAYFKAHRNEMEKK